MSDSLFFAGLDSDSHYFKINKNINIGKEMYSINISDSIYNEYDDIYKTINKMMEYQYMLYDIFERYIDEEKEELIEPRMFFNACFITHTKYIKFIEEHLQDKGFLFVKCYVICPNEDIIFMITYEIYEICKKCLEFEIIL